MARNHSIVINVDLKETRVAIIEDGVIAELHIERAAHRSTVGNVVLGKVTRVLPGMQAAFIEVGQERAAFLHVEDLIRPDDFDAYMARDPRGAKEGRRTAKPAPDAEVDEEAAMVADTSAAENDAQLPAADAQALVEADADVAANSDAPAPLAPDEDDEDEPAAVGLAARAELEDDDFEFEDSDDDSEVADDLEQDDGEDEDADVLDEDLDDVEDIEDDVEDIGDDVEDIEDDVEDIEDDVEDDSEAVQDAADQDADDSDAIEEDSDTTDLGGSDADSGVDADQEEPAAEESAAAQASEMLLAPASGDPSDTAADASDANAAEAPPDSAEADEAKSADDSQESTEAPRRGRQRRRRRRRGRGRGSAEDATDAAEAAPAEADAPAAPAEPDESDRGARGRRRRGRGRRRGGPETKAASAPVTKDKRGANRRIPARVSRSVPISEVVKEGDQVVVQISKEPIGTKGARVTSHVSLPGRYAVYLPTVEHIGISKRIGHSRERSRLRKTIEALKPQTGGLIVRTVAEGLTKKQLKADVGYLIKVWAEVGKRKQDAKAPEMLYEELDLVLKMARDFFTDEVDHIIIDDRDQYGRLARFIEMFMPQRVKDIKLYGGEEPIFDAYGIEDEIKRALGRKVPLPSGGSLIVDQAEALTAIDVNTGRYVGKGSKDLEETALKTNLEAVDEIAYQLRFRNIGGLVILDLIDMERASNREKVWRALEQRLAKDKAKTTINRISDLGLIEMTRKRTRESLGRTMHEACFYCDGTGHIQSRETIAYEILRQIRRERQTLSGYSVRVQAHPAVVDFLKFESRDALQEAETRYMRRIELVARQEYHIEQYDLQGK